MWTNNKSGTFFKKMIFRFLSTSSGVSLNDRRKLTYWNMRVFKNALLWTFRSKTINFTVVKKNLLLFVGWNSDGFSRRGLVWSRPYSSLSQSLVCNFVKVPVWSRGNNATLPSLGHLSGLTDCMWQFSVIKKKRLKQGLGCIGTNSNIL